MYLGSWNIDDYLTFQANTHAAETGTVIGDLLVLDTRHVILVKTLESHSTKVDTQGELLDLAAGDAVLVIANLFVDMADTVPAQEGLEDEALEALVEKLEKGRGKLGVVGLDKDDSLFCDADHLVEGDHGTGEVMVGLLAEDEIKVVVLKGEGLGILLAVGLDVAKLVGLLQEHVGDIGGDGFPALLLDVVGLGAKAAIPDGEPGVTGI